jgi:hypothetical protein
MSNLNAFPRQQLSYKSKNKAWRKKCVDWADNKTFLSSNLVRNTVYHKQINYDLLNGKINMRDMQSIINPDNQTASFIPDKIPHYPIMNSKLDVLKGEELARVFDARVIVTNPNAVSEIEENKKRQLFASLQALIADTSQSEEEFNQRLQELNEYYTYNYQDIKELKGNAFLKHYSKEQNFKLLFNKGFGDALTVGEEIYQCEIVGGEPILTRLNPIKVRIFKSGYSNRIEDADIIIIEDYWSPGRIIDTYYEALSPKDMKYIENLPNTIASGAVDSMGNYDERYSLVQAHMQNEEFELNNDDISAVFGATESTALLPYDLEGNIRVLRVYWKSRRKIKVVKSYDPITGDEIYTPHTEDYIVKTDLGEEVKEYWINQAWEGTKIGTDIYVNMRPCPVQYNRISNPSKCHFGIIGSIYNLNDDRPFSLVDKMKQYNYLYDAVHDRLNKLMSRNWGKIITADLAKIPANWDMEKWMYFAKVNGIAVIDSFKEGNIGAATGKLAGGLNNASSGVIDAEFGNSIQSQINLLEFIKMEMSDVAGISRQREGQISNRETVGGVERATLQSSHITEWLFATHDDVKKRAIEAFLETCKIAFKGRSVKFQHILPNNVIKMMEIDGEDFAECDYGLVVDSEADTQKLASQMETLAQAALQNQLLDFSTIMKLYSSSSIAEKQRMVESNEKAIQERNAQAQQQQLQSQQQAEQMKQQTELAKMEQEDRLNERDNETKIIVATIAANVKAQEGQADGGIQEPMSEESKEKLRESIRQFDARLALDKERLAFDKDKAKTDARLKEKQINSRPKPTKK